mgnify:CR=1 FL=1
MKRISLTFLLCTAVIISGCRNENRDDDTDAMMEQDTIQTTDNDPLQQSRKLQVEIESRSGSELSGNAVFTEENGEVTMTAVIDGLSEGMHAIHLHENADCSAEDGSSAGGHWNPTFEKHGEWGDSEGYHKGDIGNFKVDANGNGTITFSTDEWCIGCDDETKNIIGTSVVVHDGVDDFTTQPSGDAGTRVGCGEINE